MPNVRNLLLGPVPCSALVACSASAQRVFVDGNVGVGSVFERFERPTLPPIPDSIVESRLVLSLHVVAYVWIDTSGRVFKMTLRPLYDIGNDIPEASDLWDTLQVSIMKASQNWVFKPAYYDTTGLTADALKWVNQTAVARPNGGRQSHMILLSFYPDNDTPLYDRIYGLDIYGGSVVPEKNDE